VAGATDNAGWPLALQMGVKFDRVHERPFERIIGLARMPAAGLPAAELPAAELKVRSGVAGYLISHEVNDSFIATNRLLGQGEEVHWLKDKSTIEGRSYRRGRSTRGRVGRPASAWRRWLRSLVYGSIRSERLRRMARCDCGRF
jgi:hypothetical protein